MEYNYMSPAQINSLDYWSLVNMLVCQITPEIRRQILKRLMEINDRLLGTGNSTLSGNQSILNHPDPSRMATYTTKKKDFIETQHPNINVGFNNSLSLPFPNNHYPNLMVEPGKKELTIDDVIDGMVGDSPKPDELDMKLAKIKKLYDKIVADKRRRRKNAKQ